LTFRVLCEISAEYDGRRVDLKSPQQRALFALLTLAGGRAVSTDQLVERMWGPQAEGSLRSTVRTYVLRLRRGFADVGVTEPVIETLSYGYRLVAASVTDLETFDDHTVRARAARGRGDFAEASGLFTTALEQWRGLPLSGARAYYVDEERSRLEQIRVAALEERIGLDLGLGRDAVLEGELLELVKQHPLRERLHEFLMLTLYRDGRQADALEVYQRVRRTLDEELGVGPGHGLREMQRRILQADSTLFPSVVSRAGVMGCASSPDSCVDQVEPVPGSLGLITAQQLPADTSDFTGRDELVARLSQQLTSGHGPALLGLSGLDGMGKTTLAVRLAHTIRERFPDGQLYADFGGGGDRPVPVTQVLARFLRALGVSGPLPEGYEERAMLWRSCLVGRRVLIVLDDVACSDHVCQLLPATAGCSAILTSVRQFDATALRWERIGPMSESESSALFDKIAGAERRVAEPGAWLGLRDITAGYPWSVRMVGRRVVARPLWNLEDVLSQVRDETDAPTGLHEDCRRMRRAVERAMRLVNSEVVDAFRLLGAAQISDFTAESAAALFDTNRTRALAVLDELAEVQLLGRGSDGSFGMITPVRAYARMSAREADRPDEIRASLERLRRFYKESESNAKIVRDARRGPAGPEYQTRLWGGVRFVDKGEAQRWLNDHTADLEMLTEQLLCFSPVHAPVVDDSLTRVRFTPPAPAFISA
jgi:DNA-binding SARP family transcriptional activator/DNA polymerase III delta prime subunit